MRRLFFVPLLPFLMASDCDGGNDATDPPPPPPTCEGITVITQDDCTSGEEGLYCDLSGDLCYGETIASVENEGMTDVFLSPQPSPNGPMMGLDLPAGQTSTQWAGTSGLPGVGVTAMMGGDFRIVFVWQ